jgi:hypothetical protein
MSNSSPESPATPRQSRERPRRTIRNRDQLIAAKEMVMDPRVRAVVVKATFETVFVRDKGMMVGEGEVWITHDKTGFGLGAINLE